jgi:uncharacterized protein YhaN
MKLTEIHIDSSGTWRDVALHLKSRGLSVIYGPNEAGKSTLREFIGGVLFGFARRSQQNSKEVTSRPPTAGSLHFEGESGNHRLHRAAVGAMAGDACLIADDAARPAAGFLEGLLKGIDERVFESVFAAGGRDLTELCSLMGDDVAGRLFGLSPDPTGGRILEAMRRVEERRTRLIDPLQKEGQLVNLFERHDELSARLGELEELHDRHSEWCLRRDKLESEIADLRNRRAGTAEQLRGHEFLERVWGPWNRIRECQRDLDDLPELADFPEQGLARLDKLEDEIARAAECRDRLLAESRQIKEASRGPAEEGAWRVHAAAMQGFVEQRDWLVDLHERRAAAEQQALAREGEFATACEELGAGCSAERIAAADISCAARRRLSGTAESFLSALARRKAIQRKCRRLAETGRDLKEGLAESLHDLGGLSIDAALAQAREQVASITTRAQMRLRHVELTSRIENLNRQRERITLQLNLPRWVYLVLGLFAFMGVILAGWGLVAGIATSGIAGAIYAMLGITCGGLAWGLKIQYEGDARARLAEIDAAAAEAAVEERTIGESIGALAGSDAATGDPAADVCRIQTRIGELVELAANQRRLREMRNKLASLRKKLATAHREVATARHNWRELLAKLGFPETLAVDEALAAWEKLAIAAERLAAWNEARRDVQSAAAICESYGLRIDALSRRLPGGAVAGREPAEVLSNWHEQLAALDRRRIEHREQRAKLRKIQREAREYHRRAAGMKVKRNALLVQGGAASREEFEDRASTSARRIYLEDQLRDAQSDLDAACAAHTDLAIVEDDLARFEPRQNSDSIEVLRRELTDLDRDLERSFEHLGRVKHEIESLETDKQSTRVRFELCQTEDQIRALAHEWAVCESAAQTINCIRRDYERTHQPRALTVAAEHLSQMTCGKYRRIWAPLGENRLIVEDERGHSFPVQSLSRGTREQLLLAVRLAVVGELAGQGINLPVILDDVLVNFDEQRTRATIDLLVELAERGQQVLFFTCQNHLAQQFASRGIEPIWLPGQPQASAEHEEKRLAG